jgi:HAD superfamily phosphoserine phosphatase-like hydrolase
VNIYDFDGTLYKGDSSIDLWLFCLKSNPAIIKYLFRQCLALIKYHVGLIQKEKCKSEFFAFLNKIDDIDAVIIRFWEAHSKKVQIFYVRQKRDSDVIITASPRFLIEPICKILGVNNLIASEVDKQTGIWLGRNCYGAEKVMRFQEKFPNSEVNEFYSDSQSDAPMANIARKSFLVKGERIINWNIEQHHSKKAVFIIAIISVFSFLLMRSVIGNTHFWFDELISIDFARKTSLREAVVASISTDGNGVLFNSILFFWYKIVPYGEHWLWLLPEIFASLSVFATGILGKRVICDRAGVFSALIMATMPILLRYGNELRSYSLVVLIASLLLLLFFSRTKMPKILEIILYGLLLSLLVYSFPLSAVLCMISLMSDMYFIAKRKLSLIALLSYVIALVLYLPFFYLFISNPNHITSGANYLMPLGDMYEFILAILDGNVVYIYSFAYGIVLVIALTVENTKVKDKTRKFQTTAILLSALFTIFSIAIMFALNRVYASLFQSGFDIMTRYFIFTLPAIVLVIAFTFNSTFDKIETLFSLKHYRKFIAALLISPLFIYSVWRTIAVVTENPKHYYEDKQYAETAAWLFDNSDFLSTTTALYYATYDAPVFQAAKYGFFEYYITECERRTDYSMLDRLTYCQETFEVLVTLENYRELTTGEFEILINNYQLISTNDSIPIKIWERL